MTAREFKNWLNQCACAVAKNTPGALDGLRPNGVRTDMLRRIVQEICDPAKPASIILDHIVVKRITSKYSVSERFVRDIEMQLRLSARLITPVDDRRPAAIRSVAVTVLLAKEQTGYEMQEAIPALLHLELIPGAPGEVVPHVDMVMTITDHDWDEALQVALKAATKESGWDPDWGIRWRLDFENGWIPPKISGASAGGAARFGMHLLANPAEDIQGMRGISFVATCGEGGEFASVNLETLPAKLRDGKQFARPGTLHTYVVAIAHIDDLPGVQNGMLDTTPVFFANTFKEGLEKAENHLRGTWQKIPPYDAVWVKHPKKKWHPREWLEGEWQTFLEARRINLTPGGYFLLQAHPWFGKSAFAAQVFQPDHHGVPGHFFGRDGDDHDADVAVVSVVLQLCRMHGLGINDADLEPGRLAGTFKRILTAAAQQLSRNERLLKNYFRDPIQIIVFDGIDRCSNIDRFLELLPQGLPHGVSVLVTGNPCDPAGWLATNSSVHHVPLPSKDVLQKEIHDFLVKRLPGVAADDLVQLVDASRGLLGWASHMADELEQGKALIEVIRHPDDPGYGPKSQIGLIEKYRRDLVESTKSIVMVGMSAEVADSLSIEKAYIPLTTEEAGTDHGAFRDGKEENPEKNDPIDFTLVPSRALQSQSRAVVIRGEAGSGKTTASMRFVWELASRKTWPEWLIPPELNRVQSQIQQGTMETARSVGLDPATIPVFLEFKDLRESYQGILTANPPIEKPMEQFLAKKVGEATARALLDRDLPLLWILDGFDELRNFDLLNQVGGWLEKLHNDREKEKDHFLLTSRHFGASVAKSVVRTCFHGFELKLLTKEQQKEFVDHYLELLLDGTHLPQKNRSREGTPKNPGEESKMLLGKIEDQRKKSSRDAEMAQKPLLLGVICFLFARDALPDDWFHLYEDLIDQLVGRKTKANGNNFSPEERDQMKDILSALAWWFWVEGKDSKGQDSAAGDDVTEMLREWNASVQSGLLTDLLTGKDPLSFIRDHSSGIFVSTGGPTHWGFLDNKLKEYLTARHAVHGGQGAQLARELCKNPGEPYWREVVMHSVRMTPYEDASKKEKRTWETFLSDFFKGVLQGKLDQTDDRLLSHLVDPDLSEPRPRSLGK